ncbi:MAG: hypothetical protein M3Q36_02775 [bacterium]|nr:hypothetical protein [bacterium]
MPEELSNRERILFGTISILAAAGFTYDTFYRKSGPEGSVELIEEKIVELPQALVTDYTDS